MDLSFKIISAEDHIDDQLRDFIAANDKDFYPPISARTDLNKFVQSVYKYNGKYFIAYAGDKMVGLMSVYLDDPSFIYYYNYLAIDKDYRLNGISTTLFNMVHDYCRQNGAQRAMGKTWSTNNASKALFKKHGFFHVLTLEDHRSKGVHSYFYMKSFSKVSFNAPVARLGIIGGDCHYALGSFGKTISCMPKTIFEDYTPTAFTIISDTTEVPEHDGISHLLFLDLYNYPNIDLSKTNEGTEVIDLPGIVSDMVNERKKKCLLVATNNDASKAYFHVDNLVIPGPKDTSRIMEITADINSGCVSPHYYKQEITEIAAANDCTAVLLGSAEFHTMFGYDKSHNGIELFDPWMEIAIIIQHNSLKFMNHTTANNSPGI